MAPAVFRRKVPNRAYKNSTVTPGVKQKSFELFTTIVATHNNHTSENEKHEI